MKDTAIKYHKLGLSVIPIGGSKIPIGEWKPNMTKLIEPGNTFYAAKGIGMVCGAVSGGIEVLDIDCKHDALGTIYERYRTQIDKTLFDKLVIQSTLNKGYHLIYSCDQITGNKKLAKQGKEAVIETRGEGGYIAIYPTPGYKFIQKHLNEIPKITVEERNTLMSAAISLDETPEPEHQENCFKEYNENEDVLVLLQKHGCQIKQDKGEHVLLKRPGQTDSLWSADYLRSKKWFTVFSTSTEFESLKAYNPVSVFSMLECGNDWKITAQRLKEMGYGNSIKQPAQKPTIDSTKSLIKARIDLEKKPPKPPIIFYIKQFEQMRVLTMGNFSVLTGKSKAKKTFLTTFILTTVTQGGECFGKFFGDLQDGYRKVLLFDTEQGEYDSWITANRINRLTSDSSNFSAYSLREYEPLERCQIIEKGLSELRPGLAVIDGISDLAKANNDEEEAVRVSSLLLRWTKQYKCHIVTVIHQNKNDNYATGHIGSYLMKKAEVVISVSKDRDNARVSHVSCDMIRGTAEFDDLSFEVNDKGLPEVIGVEQNTEQKAINFYEPKESEGNVPF